MHPGASLLAGTWTYSKSYSKSVFTH